MFGSIGGPEILFIFIVALLLFGPRKLPEMGRALGRAAAEFRKATQEFRSTLEREVELETVRETGAQLKSAGQESREVLRALGSPGGLTPFLEDGPKGPGGNAGSETGSAPFAGPHAGPGSSAAPGTAPADPYSAEARSSSTGSPPGDGKKA